MAKIKSKILFNKKELKKISEFIIKNEDDIKKLGPSIYNETSEDSLTGRYHLFNFLKSEIGGLLKNNIFKFLIENEISNPASIQCWANTFRKGEGIKKHKHGENNEYFKCINIFREGNSAIGTTFIIEGKPVNIANKPGEALLFNSDLEHYVDPNPNNDVRISMALDIHENKILDNPIRFYHWV